MRDRQHIPSWWDAQSYKGNEEELAKITALYEPYLPLPNVGVHKQIAETLSLKSGDVYQAIKKIRADMGLPQYNDPELHPELKEKPAAKTTKVKDETKTETEASSETEVASTTETLSALVPTAALSETDTGAVVEAVKEEETKPEESSVEQTVTEPAETEAVTKTEA